MAWDRCIAHVDMQAFFPSCEQVDFPELKDKAIAVTNGEAGTTIISSSYEARAFGIKTGMKMQEALTLCPHLIKRASRPKRYSEISHSILDGLRNITPDIEVFSIDECWMDLKPIIDLYGGIDSIVEIIRESVFKASGGINCSIGISEGKLTAKFVCASNKGKTTIISSKDIKQYMAPYPVSKICGFGKQIQQFLHSKKCYTIGDIQKAPFNMLSEKYGLVGKKLQLVCNGIDTDEVITKEKLPKSMGHSKILPPYTKDLMMVENILLHLTFRLTRRMRLLNITSKTVSIYLKAQYKTIKHVYTFDKSNNCNHEFIEKVKEHLLKWKGEPLFQIGLNCNVLIYDDSHQSDMFEEQYDSKFLTLDKTMDEINKRFGANTCKPATELLTENKEIVPVIAFNFDASSKTKNTL
jgi:DNA polymerase-4